MSEFETGIVCCDDIGKYLIRQGIEDRMREVVTIFVLMFARKGEIHQGSGWKRICIRSWGMSCGQTVFG